jgi:hypothetical protein
MEAKEADTGTKRKMPVIEQHLGDVTNKTNKAVSLLDNLIGQQGRRHSVASDTPLSLALHRE